MSNLVTMLKCAFILILFLASSYAAETNPEEISMVQLGEYRLPDFKINRDTADCKNVDTLSDYAQKDKGSLENVIRDNVKALKTIDEALGLINECCADIEKLKLIQVSKSTTLKENKVNLMNAEMNEIVNSKLKQIESFLQKVSKGDLRSKCKEVQEATKDLINYVKWVNEQIQSQLIDGYLATRIFDLKELKKKCLEADDDDSTFTLARTPLNLQTLTNSDGFPSNPTRTNGESSQITEIFTQNPYVVFDVKLNSTEGKFSSCSATEYGLYDNDLQTPTYAVFQNQYFEASPTSFGFAVSDGSQNQRAYTIGKVTDKSVRINTNGKPVFSVTRSGTTFSVKFMDGSVVTQTLSSASGAAYNLKIFGAPVVGYKACTASSQLNQLSLITAVSTVSFEQASF